eukprot:s7569_g3.t1
MYQGPQAGIRYGRRPGNRVQVRRAHADRTTLIEVVCLVNPSEILQPYGMSLWTRVSSSLWAGKKGCYHPKLWCFLVAPVVCTTVTLALTVTLLWKASFEDGLSMLAGPAVLFCAEL